MDGQAQSVSVTQDEVLWDLTVTLLESISYCGREGCWPCPVF